MRRATSIRAWGAAAAAVVIVAATGCGGSGSATTTSSVPPAPQACAGHDLAGSFAVQPHSAGAGGITYLLRLRNGSDTPCVLRGLPRVRLLDRDGARLPTVVRSAGKGPAAAAVVLAPGDAATATARFSPDVPGPGEQVEGPCEPVAHGLRVRPRGGGSVVVPVQQPTRVCERGRLSFTPFRSG